MRITVRPRSEVAVKPELRTVRPPDDYIDILSKSESEFRKYISEVESNPIFSNMLSNGVVRKVGFKGRIPSYINQEFVDFLKKYEISDKAGWESDFFDRKALRNVAELTRKYKVPRGVLVKALDYCRHLQLSWSGQEEENYISQISLDDAERFHQVEDIDTLVDSGESITELADLLERYGITEQDFVEYFLSENAEPFDIARNLDLNLDAVEEIIELVEKVNIINSMQVNVVERQEIVQIRDTKPIAVIKSLKNPPRAEVQIDADEEYGCRYNIKKEESLDDDEEAIIDKLRMINQRRSLIFRIIHFLYQYQYMYFVSMNSCHLRPLSQAQIAREMGEHESTISRILRNKYIETEEGVVPFSFFCQSKGKIIERIIKIREAEELDSKKREKPFSDAEIAEILEKEYGVKVSRRTVTYYRNKANKSPKFYMRQRMINDDQKKV
jgi:DNA-directed RNA polymerase specialized sigma54-like protein